MEAFQNIFIPPLQNFDLLSSLKSGIASLQTAGPTDVVDILIVAYIIYRMMKLLKDTSAARLAKGILVLALVMLLASWFGLTSISYILRTAVTMRRSCWSSFFSPNCAACSNSSAKEI